ncbi:CDP-diacylglycerol--glycerol-3-phosphate 3-phosphatidyltransferase [Rhodalgimonas zhirmunskyi]|uniref:CDP-diacylglycerol--glycerol-3-phosphate 3-phosphatidyltransferase n=1 Tax=Rhodalgimonas zhirmunskyi TaxID=2964767 RepID=A0AAJ1X562_9RHOB|nr:CDP-diacylglycerol--glycerol-3-phosphate 3-phosphatidyltransferase [Rhodoalgimonas zhirmunskyi]MDQ2093844.1 CDP-diacylglycerol--glycerol-3-phosphate 3-phosphatidyltransferase [Rhodoalgimonas zhirmunskyi]
MKWTIPNILTLLRMLAAPMVAVMFLYFSRPLADWLALLLFAGASITDWFDGYLARLWKQETKLGTMLDPIADKAMVLIALTILVGYTESSWTPWIVLPATVILFREVFVSGLREFLGDTAGTLKVTKLAKWKTTAQMVAIAVLFSRGIFEHHHAFIGMEWAARTGVALLWIAAFLTLVTGVDYLLKALPFLKEDE